MSGKVNLETWVVTWLFLSVIVLQAQAGSIVGWGYNSNGQATPPEGNDFVAIAAGAQFSLGLKADGSILGRGTNIYGQCDVPYPNSEFAAIAAGGVHSLGLRDGGSVTAWGDNRHGQGNVPSPNSDFVAIAAGGVHSLGLRHDGSIVAWGDNHLAQCSIPLPNSGFITISAGYWYSLGLKTDGAVVAWGDNNYGQCDAPSPDSGFIAISAGSGHCLGLKADGSIVAWGDNRFGQCNIPSPNSGFITISAGHLHSLGLKNDGSIATWGANFDGQCDVPSPNSGFVAMAAGGYHSLALRATKPELGIVDKRRIDRTVFEYDCNATFQNLWPFAVKNLQLEMVQGSGNMTIIDPLVDFGDTELETLGWVTSTDTCTFQVDRSMPIDPYEVVWKVRCEKVITGQQMELTVAGVESPTSASPAGSFMMFDEIPDFGDLAELSSQWLWTGPEGGIEEDVVPDGRIDLADFAEFARKWGRN